jgi:hypothetical protein
MSLAAVRPLFRARLNALGFKEHTDAFDDQNRPQKQMEKLYRLNSGPAVGSAADSQTHEFDYDIELVITLRGVGSRNVDLSDRAWEVSEQVLADILSPAVRLGTDIKNIDPGVITVSPYTASDDNDCILTMGFTASIICLF